MAYDTFNYDIKSKMPIWWSEDTFLEPINRYSQELLKNLLGGLLSTLSVQQPVQVWKTLPTEYSWLHTYIEYDPLLKNEQGGSVFKYLTPNTPIRAEIPNSKRNSHGIIQLKLNGDDESRSKINKLTIKNAHQTITISNVNSTADIKIFTESQIILIDGVQRNDLVAGYFDYIYGQAKNTNYDELDIDDENKITYIEIESDTAVYFDLKIKHIHPVYVTEQNIRVHSVSAFPIESIKLYGLMCHDFNNKQEWKFLWEKNYSLNDRIVYDRITKQFDCETFYIQVKFHGIGMPLTYGFPQSEVPENTAFMINTYLDKWGRLLGLPRRYYKTHISDREEPYTFPPYYKYDIEQDYWYEQRLLHEYQYNEDAINSAYIKDTNLNNIALLQTINPFIEDIYVYTETITPTLDYTKEVGYINPTYLTETGDGVSWQNFHKIKNSTYVGSEILLEPKTSKSLNQKTYQTKILTLSFDDIPELPENVNIQGLELRISGLTDIHSTNLAIDKRSFMLLPIPNVINNEVQMDIDKIPIYSDMQEWQKGKGIYVIGGKKDLFGQQEITKEQIQNGLTFELGFSNISEFLKASVTIYNIQLFIYYETIEGEFSVNVEFSSKEMLLGDNGIQMKIHLENTGDIPIVDKDVYIAVPPELQITNQTFPMFDLDIGELFTIGEGVNDQIIITCEEKTGLYDVIVFCDDKVITNEIKVIKGVNANDFE